MMSQNLEIDAEIIGRHHNCGGDVVFLSSRYQGTRKCLACKVTGPLVIIETDSAAQVNLFDLDDVTVVVEDSDRTALALRSMTVPDVIGAR